jgi:hypothetical protein
MKLKLGSYRVFVIGLIMGLSAAALQAYFQVQPPVAYGISFVGHPNDLLIWITNTFNFTDWPQREVFAVYPILTVVGVFIGSFAAASRNNELALRPGPVRKRVSAVILGFLVINFGLLLGACPIRVGLWVGYGSVLGVIALVAIVIGVILATVYIRSQAMKGISR